MKISYAKEKELSTLPKGAIFVHQNHVKILKEEGTGLLKVTDLEYLQDQLLPSTARVVHYPNATLILCP